MRINKSIAVGLGLALLGGAGSSALQAAEVKLKAASFLPARSVYAKYFFRWVNQVNKECAGQIKVSVVGPAAIKSLEQWRALKDGVIDLHYGPPNYYKGAMIEGDVTILANNEAKDQRANGAWAILNKLHNEKLNAWYLTHLEGNIRFFIYTRKPAKNGRFDGFRLRSVPIYDDFFRSLGAKPVRMAPPAVYTALERGTVDGYGWPLWGVSDFGWQKYTKYRYGPGFFSAVVNIIANLDKWKSLSGAQQQCLTKETMWLEDKFPKWRSVEDAKQMKALAKAHIQYVDLGPQFRERAENMYWAKLMKANPKVIGKLKPLLLK